MRKHEAIGRKICEESEGPCSLEHVYLCARPACGNEFTTSEVTHFVRGHVKWPSVYYPFDSGLCAELSRLNGNMTEIAGAVVMYAERAEEESLAAANSGQGGSNA